MNNGEVNAVCVMCVLLEISIQYMTYVNNFSLSSVSSLNDTFN